MVLLAEASRYPTRRGQELPLNFQSNFLSIRSQVHSAADGTRHRKRLPFVGRVLEVNQ
jgi:hypothetical protein